MKIIQHRTQIHIVEYRKVFKVVGLPGSSFAFECDKDGVVDVQKLGECAQDSYQQCLKGEIRLANGKYPVHLLPQVEDDSRIYWEAAIGQCECGEEVHLEGFTNTCECGRDYNMSGQLLADRSQWGAETNESLSDILSIDNYDPEDLL